MPKNNLEYRDVTRSQLFKFVGEVNIPGMFINRDSFQNMKETPLALAGYFYEEFLYGLRKGVYVPPTLLRVHQVTRFNNVGIDSLDEIPDFVVIRPVHFLRYLQMFSDFFACTACEKFDTIAFAKGSVHCKTLLMRGRFISGVLNVSVQDAQSINKVSSGTQMVTGNLTFK